MLNSNIMCAGNTLHESLYISLLSLGDCVNFTITVIVITAPRFLNLGKFDNSTVFKLY